MTKREENKHKIISAGMTAVIRASNKETAERTAKACIRAGIKSIEITWTTPHAANILKILQESNNKQVIIGAGSILNQVMAEEAIEAGAEYIVGPNFNEEVAKQTIKHQIPYLPGCMTINEMLYAKENGASIIKLFPGSHFGPSFIKAVIAPIPDLLIMPTGGVNLENAEEWLNSGAVSIGIGGEINSAAEKGDFEYVETIGREFLKKIKKN